MLLPLNTLLQHSLLYGIILSAVLFALIAGTLYGCPMIWIGDAPPETQALAPPMTESDRRIKRIVAIATLLLLVGVFGAALVAFRRLGGGQLTFGEAALSTFLIFMTFNLVDLLLIDWLLIVKLRPSFIMILGPERPMSYGDFGYHFRGFLKGTAGGVIVSLAVAAVAVVIL